MFTGRIRVRAVTRLITTAGITGALALATIVATAGSASADPSSNTWYRLRMCESSDNYAINTGNGYYGAYQFDLPTWRSVGGTGYPNQASAAEQDYRALYLYRMRGWEPWTCARILGLTQDADAGSGVVPARPGTTPTKPPATDSTPDWPGTVYAYGDYSSHVRTFQLQLKSRGLPFEGTAYFGDTTLKYVKQLQAANGLSVTGKIDGATWAAAWDGKLTTPSHDWPGTVYSYGDSSSHLRTYQLQLKSRGWPFEGTGYFGDKTLSYTKKLQAANGLPVTGKVDRATWTAAWTGVVSNSSGSVSAPAWPGVQYHHGDYSDNLRTFQLQLKKRGLPFEGTGYFGDTTLKYVKQLQRDNGLNVVGFIGPKTWAAAWTGKL